MEMNKLVINLASREDRKQRFSENYKGSSEFQFIEAHNGEQFAKGFIPAENWRDPFRNRRMTKGEYGCFLSHFKCWLIAANSDKPTFIFEDDARFTDRYSEEKVIEYMGNHNLDFVYLGRNENNPEDVETYINDELEVPVFPYNLHAYVINRKAATKLIDMVKSDDFRVIPVDDFVAQIIAEDNLVDISFAAYKDDVVGQYSRDDLGSNIEPTEGNLSQWISDFTLHPITCETDTDKAVRLYDSAAKYDVYPKNIAKCVEWKGGNMDGPGGGQKVNLIREYLNRNEVRDTDVVIFTDGYDVMYADDIPTVLERWFDSNHRVLFAAESKCWPDPSLAQDQINRSGGKDFPFLNSGCFIGEVGELKRIFSEEVEDHSDDQEFLQRKYLSGEYDIALDHDQYIFMTNDPDIEIRGSQLYNPTTKKYGCIYHANGGEVEKQLYSDLFDKFHGNPTGLFVPPRKQDDKVFVRPLEKDMIIIDFMTRKMCEDLIASAEAHGGWEPMFGDKFPAQEIRAKELGIFDEIEKHWMEYIAPICDDYWKPMLTYGLRDAFVMKYTPETQNKLALHTDASLVTGSIKLNDDYEGGELVYPRQNVSNEYVPVGKCILFPGMVTHGHQCQEVTKGTKYSLTIWTSRYPGDVN